MNNAQYVLLALSGLSQALQAIGKIAEQAKRTREWTPEEEAAVDAQWEALKASEAWKISS